MARFVFLLLSFPFLLFANTDLLFSEDEDPALCQHVNVLSGHLNLHFQDTLVQGTKTFSLTRTYSSSGALERDEQDKDLLLRELRKNWLIQGGWDFLAYTNLLVEAPQNRESLQIFLPEKNGSAIRYIVSSQEGFLVTLKPEIQTGPCSGVLSGRANVHNNRLEFSTKNKTAVLYLPDGGTRHYRRVAHSDSDELFFLCLVEEISPSQHHTLYSYNEEKELKEICILNPKKDKVLASLKLKIIRPMGGKRPLHFQITTSDGKQLDYRSTIFKERHYLNNLVSNARPTESIQFIPGRTGTGARLHQLFLSGQEQFKVYYFEPGDALQAKQWKNDPTKKSFSADKVRLIEAPLGEHGETIPLARFSYFRTHTDVRDAEGVLTRYHHQEDLLEKIEYFDTQEQLHSCLRFFWDGPKLIGKALLNPHGQGIFSKTFHYDSAGNVIEETLWGNLTGNAPDPFPLHYDGSLEGAETHTTRYSYLSHFNIATREEREGGLIYFYSYKEGTDLLISKKTCKQGKTLLHEQFFYDEDHLLVKEVTHDGESFYLCKHHKRDPLTGMVLETKETTSPSEKLLRRTEFFYSSRKELIREDVYDSTNTYRYSLHTEYDPRGRVIRKTTPLGRGNEYLYDSLGRVLESKEVGSSKKVYTYSPLGLPISCTQNGSTSYTHYDTKGRLLEQVDSKGNSTRQTYDSFGRCQQTQFPPLQEASGEILHPTILFSHDLSGNIHSTTSPRGETTYTSYNALRKPILIITPDGEETRHTYLKAGPLEQTRHPDGTITYYTYDPLHRMTSQISYAANGTLLSEEYWVYNASHLLSYTDPKGLTTTYSYDSAGRRIAEESHGVRTTYSYDPLGFEEKISDGNLTHVTLRNCEGEIAEQWTEAQGIIENHMRFFYDEEGRKIRAERRTSQGIAIDYFTYDQQGRLRQHSGPLGEETLFLFSETELSNLGQRVLQKTTIDPLRHTTIETYDALEHLLSLEKKDSSGNTVALEFFAYNSCGHRVRRTSTVYQGVEQKRETTISWETDNAGRPLQELVGEKQLTSYVYDSRGRVSKKILPSLITLSYRYDGIGRLEELESSDGSIHYQYFYEQGTSPTQICDLLSHTSLIREYDLCGNLVQEMTPTQLLYQWKYDAYSRPTQFILPDQSSIAYSYSGAHLSKVERLSSEGKSLYEHNYLLFDPNGHVQTETLPHHLGISHTAHDLLERPCKQNSSHLQQEISYGPSGLVLRTGSSLLGPKSYSYDPLDQLAQEGDSSYSFDSLGNPLGWTVGNSNQLLDSSTTSLEYDPDGNPLRLHEKMGTTEFAYDALGRLTQIHSPNGTVRYTYDPLSRLATKERNSREKLLYLYDREIEVGTLSANTICELRVVGLGIQADRGGTIAIELGTNVFIPLHDFQGNIIALLTPSGELAEKYSLDAFGKGSTPSCNPWKFCSKREEEGLLFFGKRFYSPQLGRWLTPDPAGYVDTANLYLFVRNSPTRRLDLFGLSSTTYPWGGERDIGIELNIGEISFDSENREVLSCKVTFGNVTVDGIISCGNWNQLQFSPEELSSGKINIFDHCHELFPKEGICLVTLLNGVNTPLAHLHKMGQSVKNNLPNSIPLLGLHNPSRGLLSDLNRVRREKNGKETAAVARTRQFMEILSDACRSVSPPALWLHIAHSEGGLQTYRAIDGMTPDKKAQLEEHLYLFSLGSAQPIPRGFGKQAKNIYSKRDFITRNFGKSFRKHPDYVITFTDCLSSRKEMVAWVADHAFLGTTYQKALSDYLKQGAQKEGFYDDPKR